MTGPRWTKRGVALLLSVSANVFLAFLIGAHMLHYRNYKPPGKLDRFLATVPGELSTADAVKFKAIIDRDRSNLLEEEGQLRRARDRVIETLKAEPFDAAAFLQAVGEARAKRTALEHTFETSFLEAAQKISAEGRRQLAQLRVNPG